MRVGEVMDKEPLTIPATTTVAEFSARIASGDLKSRGGKAHLLVDAKGIARNTQL